MSKRDSYIRIRLYEKEKEVWENFVDKNKNKFPTVSHFIRYIVNEYIEKDPHQTVKNTTNGNNVSKRDLLTMLKEQYNRQDKTIEGYMKKVDELLEEGRKDKEIVIEHSVKGKILDWIGRFPNKLASEDIADLINQKEPEALIILNEMEKQELLECNKDMTYNLLGDN